MKLLNLGVLAHVDAGKTTLTERLLYEAGVIHEIGSVDKGTTQTDTLELERRRGITIRSAVASFAIGEVGVNLIDTPGHPDFIAEVERALRVLDGAVLVLSAVEGVQPQTRVLMRALERGSVPTVLFVNKVDRLGADVDRTLAAIKELLTPDVIPFTTARALGARTATVTARDDADLRIELTRILAERSDAVLARYVADERVDPVTLQTELVRQVAAARVHPLFVGSALTGVGCTALMDGVARLLPSAPQDRDAAPSGLVFKIERSRSGGKLTYVRMHRGTLHVRDRIELGTTARPITAIDVFAGAPAERRDAVGAGEIGRLAGLAEARIGDRIGTGPAPGDTGAFPLPAMEAVVDPVTDSDGPALRAALRELADQDPLINVRLEADGGLSVSLYGEVQQEVLASTLELEHGIAVSFRDATPICVERPRRGGSAVELLEDPSNPVSATVGIRIEPLEPDAGVRFELGIESRIAPIYIYKTHAAFEAAMAEHVHAALEVGLFGWQVTDCVVTLTECGYYVGDGKVPPGRTRTTAGDFKRLTPIVVREALERAGTAVCEPMMRARLEAPTTALRATAALVARAGGQIEEEAVDGATFVLTALVPATKSQLLQRSLHGVTGGEGICEAHLVGHRPVEGAALVRRTPGRSNRASEADPVT